MDDLLKNIAICVERGKINLNVPHPIDMKGMPGADELTKRAIEENISPEIILNQGLIVGMTNIGEKFRLNQVFLPDLLMSAKAMMTAMQHIKPFYASGEIKKKGVFVIGTVAGDLHEIGKNIVSMVVQGAGWEVIDLGFDVPIQKFLNKVEENPNCVIGLSALLTTTMASMAKTVEAIKSKHPQTAIIVGGAPLSKKFADSIGADEYSSDPHGAVEFLNKKILVS